MPRPSIYVREDAVEAAMQAFWDDGYHGTGVSALEERTGLNRSSLYLGFGSKRELFASALDLYTEVVLDRLLAPMETEPLDPGSIAAFFSGVKEIVTDSRGHRGCLMVNTVAELAARDDEGTARSAAFWDRVRRAFTRALAGSASGDEVDDDTISRRAGMLTASTLGIWLSARIDPATAASLCDEMTAEVESWRSSRPESGPSRSRGH